MNILADTSVWSQVLRRHQNTRVADQLREYIIKEKVYVLGIIAQEILSGITNSHLFEEIKNTFLDFPYLEPRKEDYTYAASLKNKLRSKGVTIHTIDALIAAMAIQHDCLLFTIDQDFQAISKYLPLKFTPPISV